MPKRKATFRLYPNATEKAALEETLSLHCRVYNALLEEHRRRYEAGETTFSFQAMCKALTLWRECAKSLATLNAQGLQVTAKRAALAFEAFFRRVKKGETPGYPRFKSWKRFSGFGFKTHGDGWKLMQAHCALKRGGRCAGYEYGAVRLSGIGTVSMRGRAGFDGVPKTAEVMRRGDKWYLSVTFDVTENEIRRQGGRVSTAFDWGVTTLLTQVTGDALTGEIEKVENPRWLKKQLGKIVELQQGTSRLETAAKLASGKDRGFPVNARLERLYRRLRAVHGKIARQRHDFYHKLTAAMVARFGLIVTEELSVANMSRAPKPKKNEDGTYAPNGAAAKAGLNRSIQDAAPAGLIAKLRYKAADAGSKFNPIPTRKVKPSQRCCLCGATEKHELSVRRWTCKCGAEHDRDENAARTMLRYAYEGDWWNRKDGAGTVPAAAARAA
ncbi:transposase [Paraburkholderia sp. UCT31]|uniref:RNA-guided endonuclease InsQ/TnpB family protein n=1 Tax=Paraburkholderia sp. UCT31 TaxID=2615209 RepID=UPI0016550D4A|nr:RNA-guided endonuclease TnpB family protein [Paraburkholderia sp. UCT31]MBC8737058.1 transposase [Paraburkholderia sp. UCT31]